MKNKSTAQSVITGIVIGLIATTIGSIIWILSFSHMDIETTIRTSYREGLLGAILAAGAMLNIPAFLLFLKQKKTSEAKGVVIATFIIAFFVIFQKLT